MEPKRAHGRGSASRMLNRGGYPDRLVVVQLLCCPLDAGTRDEYAPRRGRIGGQATSGDLNLAVDNPVPQRDVWCQARWNRSGCHPVIKRCREHHRVAYGQAQDRDRTLVTLHASPAGTS
jgi:hypothetical protein